jgi:hypothetical protein
MKPILHYSSNPNLIPASCGRHARTNNRTSIGKLTTCGLCRATIEFRKKYPELAISLGSRGRPTSPGVSCSGRFKVSFDIAEWWEIQPNKSMVLSAALTAYAKKQLK